MAYDSAATRTRLLDAAYTEFAARGFAGTRVDRVAVQAGANKQAIYLYFGSKEDLFDAVLQDRLGILADQVPYTPDDLTGYIGALFDHMAEHPELVRLTQWKLLERPDATDLEVRSHVSKAESLAERLGISAPSGMDVLMLALAMAQAWNTTSELVRSMGQTNERRLVQHRSALTAAVAAVEVAFARNASASMAR
jgi:AcrR family transcriptional regulator